MYGFIILAILSEGVSGLHGYFHFVVIGGMLIASNFMIPNYFNPEGVSINQHILAHLVGSIVGTIPFALLAGIGFAAARRKPALNSQPAI